MWPVGRDDTSSLDVAPRTRAIYTHTYILRIYIDALPGTYSHL